MQLSSSAPRIVIVGAGQAGLALAAALVRAGLIPQHDFTVIDRASGPDRLAWRRRWRSLQLFTPAWFSSLPGRPISGDQDRHPMGHEVADYLDDFRESIGVQPSWGVHAFDVIPAESGIILMTSAGPLEATAVIAATGPFGAPRLPDLAASLQHETVLHSDDYRTPEQMPPGSVLVVGAGNSGLQIAAELARTHSVTIARGRRSPRLPQRLLHTEIFRVLHRTHLLRVPARSLLGRILSRRELVIGDGLAALRRRGVRVEGRVVAAEDGAVTFATGRTRAFDAVVFATGYRRGHEWLPSAARASHPRADGATVIAGLYVLGASWQRDRSSALLGGIGRDAELLAQHLLRAHHLKPSRRRP